VQLPGSKNLRLIKGVRLGNLIGNPHPVKKESTEKKSRKPKPAKEKDLNRTRSQN
jgi:hypothetical protein